jgi:hypothetical protein
MKKPLKVAQFSDINFLLIPCTKTTVVVYIVIRPAEFIVRKKGIFLMREREITFQQTRPDR